MLNIKHMEQDEIRKEIRIRHQWLNHDDDCTPAGFRKSWQCHRELDQLEAALVHHANS